MFEIFEQSGSISLTAHASVIELLVGFRQKTRNQQCLGFEEECDFFRQLIWNHPCERLIEDAGQERALAERFYPIKLRKIESRDLITAVSVRETTTRRYTRTPVADRVHQLVQQLNGGE